MALGANSEKPESSFFSCGCSTRVNFYSRQQRRERSLRPARCRGRLLQFTVKIGTPDAARSANGTKQWYVGQFLCLLPTRQSATTTSSRRQMWDVWDTSLWQLWPKEPRGRVYLTPTQETEAAAASASQHGSQSVILRDMHCVSRVATMGSRNGATFSLPTIGSIDHFIRFGAGSHEKVSQDAIIAGCQTMTRRWMLEAPVPLLMQRPLACIWRLRSVRLRILDLSIASG